MDELLIIKSVLRVHQKLLLNLVQSSVHRVIAQVGFSHRVAKGLALGQKGTLGLGGNLGVRGEVLLKRLYHDVSLIGTLF